MDDKTAEAVNYRFSGYQLPMIELDMTGPQFVCLHPHPYYYGQPLFWSKPIFTATRFDSPQDNPSRMNEGSGATYENQIPSNVAKSSGRYKMIGINIEKSV